MRFALPEPGTPAGARLTTRLRATAVAAATLGIAIIAVAFAVGEAVPALAGAVVITAGGVLATCAQDMAHTERTLAALTPPEEKP